MIRMVFRGVFIIVDVYFIFVLGEYLDGFYFGFEGGKKGNLNVEFMGFDGGLVDLKVSFFMLSKSWRKNFIGFKLILSGLVGGVVGYVFISWDEKKFVFVIGFDVGGILIDVFCFDGKYEIVYEIIIAGILI